MRSPYYDRTGGPIDLFEWARLTEDDEYRRIGHAVVCDAADPSKAYRVSTIWIGIDTALGPPMIFETLVFGKESEQVRGARYATEDQAREGHTAMVVSVCAELTDPVVVDAEDIERRGAD